MLRSMSTHVKKSKEQFLVNNSKLKIIKAKKFSGLCRVQSDDDTLAENQDLVNIVVIFR